MKNIQNTLKIEEKISEVSKTGRPQKSIGFSGNVNFYLLSLHHPLQTAFLHFIFFYSDLCPAKMIESFFCIPSLNKVP